MTVENLLIVFLPTLRIPAPLLTLLIEKPELLLVPPPKEDPLRKTGSSGKEKDHKSSKRKVATHDKKSLTGGKGIVDGADAQKLESPKARYRYRGVDREAVLKALSRTNSDPSVGESPDTKSEKD